MGCSPRNPIRFTDALAFGTSSKRLAGAAMRDEVGRVRGWVGMGWGGVRVGS